MVKETQTTNVETMEAYEAVASHYGEYSSKKADYLNAVDELVIKYLSPKLRLIDIGSGDGRRLAKIKQRVHLKEAVAIEPSINMAKICREVAQVKVYEEFAENLHTLDLDKFDVAIALWNVFGHIPSTVSRLRSLQNIHQLLTPNGFLILDVNNRHNALAYGRWNVFLRKLVDAVAFDESRGDAVYDWRIGEKVFKSKGHLFVPKEIEGLFRKAGFRIRDRFSLNYSTGELSTSRYRGQLFYVLDKA